MSTAVRQQINLYQPVATEERKPIANATVGIAAAAAAVVISLFAMWAFGAHQVAGLQHAVNTLRLQQEAHEQAMINAGAAQTPRLTPAQVQAQIKILAAALAARNQALAQLHAGVAGQKKGFAARMEALARRHTDGLWIDRIALSGMDGAMSVGGGTVDPDLVPRYLRSLSGEAALAGVRFEELLIERPLPKTDENGEKVETADPHSMRFRAESSSLRVPDPEKAS